MYLKKILNNILNNKHSPKSILFLCFYRVRWWGSGFSRNSETLTHQLRLVPNTEVMLLVPSASFCS